MIAGWIVAASLFGLLGGFAIGLVAAYFAWRWYEGRPIELAVKPVVRSKVLDAAFYDDSPE